MLYLPDSLFLYLCVTIKTSDKGERSIHSKVYTKEELNSFSRETLAAIHPVHAGSNR